MTLPKNPHLAFAWLWVGGKPITVDDITKRPKHLESFKCEFMVETIGTFEFTLFDPDYDVIEDLVSKSGGKCQFQFGYASGGEKSPVYDGFITEYVPQFLVDGIRIHLKGFSLGLVLHNKIKTRTFEDKKPHEIVTEVVESAGLKAEVEDTNPVEQREDCEDSKLKHKTWHQHSTDLALIMNQLQEQSERAKDGAAGYVTYFDPDTKKVHFHPPPDEAPFRTFRWRHRLTEIIEFCPHFNGNLLAMIFFGGSSMNPTTNLTDTSQKACLKSDGVGTGKGQPTDPAYAKTRNPIGEKEFVDEGGRSYKVHSDEYFGERAAKHWWYRYAWLAAFTGTLKVVGDPELKPFKKYHVLVQKKDGGLHWTSGIYWSNGIEHEIVGGEYTTTLKLWRSTSKSGEKSSKTLAGGGMAASHTQANTIAHVASH